MIDEDRKKLRDKAPLRHKLRIVFKEVREKKDPWRPRNAIEAELQRKREEYFEPPPKPKKRFLDFIID